VTVDDALKATVPLDDTTLDQVTGGVGSQGSSLTFQRMPLSLREVAAGRDAELHLSAPSIASSSSADMLTVQQQL
jgi:hypothetical protein